MSHSGRASPFGKGRDVEDISVIKPLAVADSPWDAGLKEQLLSVDKFSKTAGATSFFEAKGSQQGATNSSVEKVLSHYKEIQTDFDNSASSLAQRFTYLKDAVSKFFTASGDVIKQKGQKETEEEFLLQVYENDKKSLENYLSALEKVISQTQEKAKKSSSSNLSFTIIDNSKRKTKSAQIF